MGQGDVAKKLPKREEGSFFGEGKPGVGVKAPQCRCSNMLYAVVLIRTDPLTLLSEVRFLLLLKGSIAQRLEHSSLDAQVRILLPERV
jgi:hypothetical protein